MAAPMPRVPPVTKATLPMNSSLETLFAALHFDSQRECPRGLSARTFSLTVEMKRREERFKGGIHGKGGFGHGRNARHRRRHLPGSEEGGLQRRGQLWRQ